MTEDLHARRPGDQFLRDAGIELPCAEQFGWFGGFGSGSILARCDRPYGHTGPHLSEDSAMAGGRSPRDDERTNAVLRQIMEGRG